MSQQVQVNLSKLNNENIGDFESKFVGKILESPFFMLTFWRIRVKETVEKSYAHCYQDNYKNDRYLFILNDFETKWINATFNPNKTITITCHEQHFESEFTINSTKYKTIHSYHDFDPIFLIYLNTLVEYYQYKPFTLNLSSLNQWQFFIRHGLHLLSTMIESNTDTALFYGLITKLQVTHHDWIKHTSKLINFLSIGINNISPRPQKRRPKLSKSMPNPKKGTDYIYNPVTWEITHESVLKIHMDIDPPENEPIKNNSSTRLATSIPFINHKETINVDSSCKNDISKNKLASIKQEICSILSEECEPNCVLCETVNKLCI